MGEDQFRELGLLREGEFAGDFKGDESVGEKFFGKHPFGEHTTSICGWLDNREVAVTVLENIFELVV